MQGIYADGRGMEDTDKVLLHFGSSLLNLFICSSGYYPLYGETLSNINSIVLKQDDNRCRPYLIEETDLLNRFYEEFSSFFENSYFTVRETFLLPEDMKSQNFYLSTEPLRQNHNFSKHITDDKNNIFNRYSVFPSESDRVVLRAVDSVLFAVL